jgi:hypothetical protein
LLAALLLPTRRDPFLGPRLKRLVQSVGLPKPRSRERLGEDALNVDELELQAAKILACQVGEQPARKACFGHLAQDEEHLLGRELAPAASSVGVPGAQAVRGTKTSQQTCHPTADDACHDAPLSLPRAAPPVPHHSVNPSAKTISLGDSRVPRRLTSRVLKRRVSR